MKTAQLITGELVNVLSTKPENGRVKVMGTGWNDGEVWSVPEVDMVDCTPENCKLEACPEVKRCFD